MELTREVRFSLVAQGLESPITNSWGGWPTSTGLAPHLTLRVRVSGDVDPTTGFLCNISQIDQAVRSRVMPVMYARWQTAPTAAERLVQEAAPALAAALPAGVRLRGLELRTTPYLAYTWHAGGTEMISITQSFEFAAAHRLHCPQLSEDENRRTFGKCTNPNGHGHNYTVEVTITGRPDSQTGVLLPVGELEQVVRTQVIDRFDHKHLNEDCAEFAALNPSVENITRVIWEKLNGRFGSARLTRVRVYETPKTAAEYCGEP